MKLRTIAATCLGLVTGGVADGALAPFGDGARVCFVGDSITKQGGYHAEILLFYATRLPNTRQQTWNSGIAGDTAAGGIKRYDWDIAPRKPTIVTVMMGMNDVGRGYYAKSDADETVLTKRRQAIERSIANMGEIAERVTGDGARAIFITPSLYDQTAQLEAPCMFGANDALKACAEGMRQIAKGNPGVDVVEFNAPMAAINETWQAKDPTFTVVGRDRIHPDAVGHLVMAYLFLKAQGVPGTVAVMELDAKERAIVRQENCSVSNLSFSDGRTTFDCLERALPFPVEKRSSKALELVPFMQELNREILRVRDLPNGNYELRVDGLSICRTTADALAEGVNLAALTDTPQYKQAVQVRGIVAKRHRLEKVIRTYALLKQQFFPDKDELTPAMEAEILQSNLEKLKGKTGVWNTYRSTMIEGYLGTPGGKAAVEEQCDELMQRIYEVSKPQPHRYELVRVLENGRGK